MDFDKNEIMRSIYQPIHQNILGLNRAIDDFVEGFTGLSIGELYRYFFDKEGKYLRPALFFLSAGLIGGCKVFEQDDKGYKLALSLELLHSASLIHDDILDGDQMRRGQLVLNERYGYKVALLAGDTLFSKAYHMVSTEFAKDYACKISELSYEMCLAEAEQALGIEDRDKYIKVITGKTAVFTKICCELGVMFAGGHEEHVKRLGEVGFNFGIAYQIYDDVKDGDPNILGHATLEDARTYLDHCLLLLDDFQESAYKNSLLSLIAFMERRL